MRILRKFLCYTTFFAVFAIAVLGAVLLFSSVPIGSLVDLKNEVWVRTGLDITYADLRLDFSSGLRFRALDVQARIPGNSEGVKAKKIILTLDPAAVLHGALMVRALTVLGLQAKVERRSDGIFLDGYELSRRSEASAPAIDVVSLLQKMHGADAKHPYLMALRSVRIDASLISYSDLLTARFFHLRKIELSLDNMSRGELILRLQTDIEDEALRVPLAISIRHGAGKDHLSFTLDAECPGTSAFGGMVAAEIAQSLQASLHLRSSGELGAGLSVRYADFELRAGKGSMLIPSVFAGPLAIEALRIEGEFKQEAGGEVFLKTVEVRDDNSFEIKGSGSVTSLFAGPGLTLKLTAGGTDIDRLAKYLPYTLAPELSLWLDKRLNLAKVSNIAVSLSREPGESDSQFGLRASFDFSNLEVNFLDTFPPARDLAGRFNMQDGAVSVSSASGRIGKEKLNDVNVTIADVFSKETVLFTVKGGISGPVDEVLTALGSIGVKSKHIAITSGQQTSLLNLSFPLKPDLTAADFRYSVSSSFRELLGDIPEGGLRVVATKAQLTLDERRFSFSGDGTLDGQKVSVTLEDSVRDFGAMMKARLLGTVSSEMLGGIGSSMIPVVFPVPGDIPFDLSVQSAGRAIYDISGTLDLASPAISVPALSWEKPQTKGPAEMKVQARLNSESRRVSVGAVSVSAPQMEFAGSGEGTIDKVDGLRVAAAKLNTGRTNVTAQINLPEISISGSTLDLRGFQQSGQGQSGEYPPELGLSASVGEVLFSSGSIFDLRLNVQRMNSVWQNIAVQGRSAEKDFFQASLQAEQNSPVLRVSADDTGLILQRLGITGRVLRGKLDAELTSRTKTGFDFDAIDGTVRIKNTRIKDSPLLFRILSVLSLESLLTRGQGVEFREIKATFSKTGSKFRVDNGMANGPVLVIYFHGDIDPVADTLALTGDAVPLRSLGKFAENIPLIGKAISGAQKNLVAAHFTISGRASSPELSLDVLGSLPTWILEKPANFLRSAIP